MYRNIREYHSIPTKQSNAIWEDFPVLFEMYDIDRVIEIGTYCGGLSYFLTQKWPHLEYMGYEIDERVLHDKVKDLNIVVRDVFTDIPNAIEYIQKPGRTLVLCDGGDKIKEFNLFSKHLKTGDIIMCHDYVDDRTYFDIRTIAGWRKPESTWSAIRDAIHQNKLIETPFVNFQKSLWSCYYKL